MTFFDYKKNIVTLTCCESDRNCFTYVTTDVKAAGTADVEVLTQGLRYLPNITEDALCWIWRYCCQDNFLYRLQEVDQRTCLEDKAAIATCDMQRVLSVQDGTLGSGNTSRTQGSLRDVQEAPR